jgi:hypothetical protein
VRTKLFHAHGTTDMTKLILIFRNFAKAPNNAICVTDIVLLPIYVKSCGTTVAPPHCSLFKYRTVSGHVMFCVQVCTATYCNCFWKGNYMPPACPSVTLHSYWIWKHTLIGWLIIMKETHIGVDLDLISPLLTKNIPIEVLRKVFKIPKGFQLISITS